ncbi:hypothetical protein PtB15_12B192 [Puccinia triticina]|nr:hypothetical protein PtB15_12B192 [Puccinia triticina]
MLPRRPFITRKDRAALQQKLQQKRGATLHSRRVNPGPGRLKAPAPQINHFGKQSHGHVTSAKMFPSVGTLTVPEIKQILRENHVKFHSKDLRPTLINHYKTMVNQLTGLHPKRPRILAGSPNLQPTNRQSPTGALERTPDIDCSENPSHNKDDPEISDNAHTQDPPPSDPLESKSEDLRRSNSPILTRRSQQSKPRVHNRHILSDSDDLESQIDANLLGDESASSSKESSSEEEDEWIPHSYEENSDEEIENNDTAITNNNTDMDIGNNNIANTNDRPIPESLSTEFIRSEVAARGFPCQNLDRTQLISIYSVIDDRPPITQSGQTYRNPTPDIPSSDPLQAPDHNSSDESPDTNNYHGHASNCQAMHARTAADIEILKKDQQRTLVQIDEILEIIRKQRQESQTQSSSPSSETSSNVQRSNFRKLLRQHIAILLGWTKKKKAYPTPATEGQRSQWGRPLAPTTSNPSLLFPHKAATPQQVQILQEMMQQAGVTRFAPNFAFAPTAPENQFLWDLAVDMFTELADCGEYYVPPELKRRYKNVQSLPEEKIKTQVNSAKRKYRRQHLIEHRLTVAAKLGGLEPLYSAIKAACSDDKTDDKQSPPRNTKKKGPKHCKILQVPWRSEKLTQLLLHLDEIDSRQKELSNRKRSGPPPRVRTQNPNAEHSIVAPPPGLPQDCISRSWLDEHFITPEALDLRPPCDLNSIARSIRQKTFALFSTPPSSQ